MTPCTYERPSISDEFGTYTSNADAEIARQLTRIADALSRPTPAAPDEEVTDEVLELGVRTFMEYDGDDLPSMLAAYRAMRAARPAPTPVAEESKGGMATPHTCAHCAYYTERVPSCSGRCQKFDGDTDAFDTCSHWQAAPTPSESAQPSEELRLLRRLRSALLDDRGLAGWQNAGQCPNDTALRHSTAYAIARLLAALDAAEGGGR